MLRRLLPFCLLLLPVLSQAESSVAPDHERARAAVESGRSQPLRRLLDKVAASYPGKVWQVELEGDEDHLSYEVKLLAQDGSLQVLHYDAATLELTRQETGRRHHADRYDGHHEDEAGH